MKEIKIKLDSDEYFFITEKIGIFHECKNTMTEALINKTPFVLYIKESYLIFSYEYISSIKVIVIKEI
jgi:hypothetical protein